MRQVHGKVQIFFYVETIGFHILPHNAYIVVEVKFALSEFDRFIGPDTMFGSA